MPPASSAPELLSTATQQAEALREGLGLERRRVGEVRLGLRTLNAGALFSWAEGRKRAQAALLTQEHALLETLCALFPESAQTSRPLEEACLALGAEGMQLRQVLAQLRDEATRLRTEELLTQALLRQSKGVVDACLRTLLPQGHGYGPSGAPFSAPSHPYLSRRG